MGAIQPIVLVDLELTGHTDCSEGHMGSGPSLGLEACGHRAGRRSFALLPLTFLLLDRSRLAPSFRRRRLYRPNLAFHWEDYFVVVPDDPEGGHLLLHLDLHLPP